MVVPRFRGGREGGFGDAPSQQPHAKTPFVGGVVSIGKNFLFIDNIPKDRAQKGGSPADASHEGGGALVYPEEGWTLDGSGLIEGRPCTVFFGYLAGGKVGVRGGGAQGGERGTIHQVGGAGGDHFQEQTKGINKPP